MKKTLTVIIALLVITSFVITPAVAKGGRGLGVNRNVGAERPPVCSGTCVLIPAQCPPKPRNDRAKKAAARAPAMAARNSDSGVAPRCRPPVMGIKKLVNGVCKCVKKFDPKPVCRKGYRLAGRKCVKEVRARARKIKKVLEPRLVCKRPKVVKTVRINGKLVQKCVMPPKPKPKPCRKDKFGRCITNRNAK